MFYLLDNFDTKNPRSILTMLMYSIFMKLVELIYRVSTSTQSHFFRNETEQGFQYGRE